MMLYRGDDGDDDELAVDYAMHYMRGDKRVRVTAPVKATAKNEVSTHSGVQTFTTRSKTNKQASRELCNILYKKNIFFVTCTIVCCSWTCSGVSFDTYSCTWSVPF